MSPIPILVLVDCEPDRREPALDRTLPWTGFERFFDFLAAGRERLSARTGRPSHFSWFWRMDPQIETVYGSAGWAAAAYAGQIGHMTRAGDAMGLHTHAFRWHPAAGRWITDHADLAWIETCLRRSFAAYRSAFGRDCTLFRFGDGWFDAAIIPLLEELGARIDLTIEPDVPPCAKVVPHELATGCLPDRRGTPRQPYHPARSDFRRHDPTGLVRLWALPVSTAALIRRPKLRHPLRLLRWWTSPKRSARQFNLEILPKRFPQVLDRVLTAATPGYAAICVRSDAGTSRERLDVVARNLDSLLQHPLAERFRFMNAEEALAALTPARRGP